MIMSFNYKIQFANSVRIVLQCHVSVFGDVVCSGWRCVGRCELNTNSVRGVASRVYEEVAGIRSAVCWTLENLQGLDDLRCHWFWMSLFFILSMSNVQWLMQRHQSVEVRLKLWDKLMRSVKVSCLLSDQCSASLTAICCSCFFTLSVGTATETPSTRGVSCYFRSSGWSVQNLRSLQQESRASRFEKVRGFTKISDC